MYKYPVKYDSEFRSWLSGGNRPSLRTYDGRLPLASAGYPLPSKLNDRIVSKLFSHGGLLGSGLINIINDDMGSGDYHTPIDTNGREKKGVKVARDGAIPDADQITFDDVKTEAAKYTSGFYIVSNELISDSPLFNEYLDSVMRGRVSDAINEDLSAILRASVTQSTAVAKTGVTLEKVIGLKYATKKAYRSRDESRFVMNSDTLKSIIDGVTTESDLKKWVERRGSETFIDGTLVHIDESMPDTDAVPGTGETIVPVLFADLSFLSFRKIPYVSIVRLTEILAENDQTKIAAITMGDAYFPVKDAGVGLPITKAAYSVEPVAQVIADDAEIITDEQIQELTVEEKPAAKKRAPRKSKTTK
ncbi:phage major capsid protein [Photobacterium indicum]|uniref:Phage major capsid protein n=1 Tax=Photobacterium indicum TaxID=81447 RepID=A0A2T3L3C6_9GAMM|nr:phage major capsid protein [Photobacterium indicum]PSV43605.1 phage major capsid protein [Photobacterium indicum]